MEVIVRRTVLYPAPQSLEQWVVLNGHESLTPTAARAALRIAFGQPYGGEVWTVPLVTSDGPDYASQYGYRVYPDYTEKLYPEIL